MDSVQRRLPHRNPALLSREVDGEFVVVDEAANAAHQLAGPSADVWREIETGAPSGLTTEEQDVVIAELSSLGLLSEPKGMTRRMMLQRTGVVVAATGMSTIVLPAAAAHASALATLVLNPAAGQVGITVTLSGTGYAPNTAIAVTFGGAVVAVSPAGVTTTATGAIPAGTTITVPNQSTGSKTVVVTAGKIASAIFTIGAATPTITLSPASGPKTAAQRVTISGSGFTPNSNITGSTSNTGQGAAIATIAGQTYTTSSTGTFTADFTVTGRSNGTSQTISISDSATPARTASASYEVF